MAEPTPSVGERRGSAVRYERPELRRHMALALDVDDLVVATRLAEQLSPWFGVAKVGLELFSATGSEAVAALAAFDFQVFLDLKLHDIPTTVRKAARVLGELGASYVTVHSQGGVEMMRAGVEGLAEGSARAGTSPAKVLAVTVLTSDPGAPDHVLDRRVEAAEAAGCGGVVCAATDVARAKRLAPGLMAVVPGIRPTGTSRDDQARPATPEAALGSGADLLVIGRPVTAAQDPPAAAEAIYAALV